MAGELAWLPVHDLLTAVAARTTAPGGGACAALTTAMAAALTVMAARFTDDSPVAGRADRLRVRATELADADVAAYGRFVQARREHGRDSPEATDALDVAVDVPMQVARAAAEVASLAGLLARDGNPRLRGDAVTGCWLAAAAASSAATLVAENLAATPDDPRVTAAAGSANDARATAARLT